MLILSIAQFSARRPVLYVCVMAILIHLFFAALIALAVWLQPANAKEIPNAKEAGQASSQLWKASELWTVQVFTPTSGYAYLNCASHGEFLAQSAQGSIGYAAWTCEEYGEVWAEAMWKRPAGQHALSLHMDGTEHSGCVLMEQAWNWQMGYGFRTYQCEK